MTGGQSTTDASQVRYAQTISDRVRVTGFSSGFDYLRLTLAVAVLVWHTFPILHDVPVARDFFTSPWGVLPRIILPMFFALSGFLVAASLERNSLPIFLAYRAIRIVPALAMEVGLSALILGPLMTTLPLSEYFSQRQVYGYFLNAIGFIRYLLPGVFENNPWPRFVNGSLWTVPFELECYIALAMLAVVGITARVRWLVAIILVASIALLLYGFTFNLTEFRSDDQVSGRVLVLCFLSGVPRTLCFFGASGRIPDRLDRTRESAKAADLAEWRLFLRNLSLRVSDAANACRPFPVDRMVSFACGNLVCSAVCRLLVARH
jgi:peptidoglycan/LPS O-acetylase OafA/YrhL